MKTFIAPDTLDVWTVRLAELAEGLDLTDEEGRATYRGRVAEATDDAASEQIGSMAEHFGQTPANRSRRAACRALADACIRRACAAGLPSAPSPQLPALEVGQLHRYAPDASGRRRLSFTCRAASRAVVEVQVAHSAGGDEPQEQIDAFAGALRELVAGTERRVADAERRADNLRHGLRQAQRELAAERAKLAAYDKGRFARGEAYALAGPDGAVWLMGRPSSSAFGFWFASWGDLARDRPGLRPCGTCPSQDRGSNEVYIVMRPIGDLTGEISSDPSKG